MSEIGPELNYFDGLRDGEKKAAPEIAQLRAALKSSAEQVTKLAFSMPPPNSYTPQFVMIAQAMDRAIQQPTSSSLPREPKE